MRLAVASGKGGTGKTTLAVSLALALAALRGREPVTLLDCDVEQPNDHLFFTLGTLGNHSVNVSVPELRVDRCTGCGECAAACRFGALAVVKGRLLSFPELCHGCGACWLTCSTGGVTRGARRIGSVYDATTTAEQANLRLVWGELNPGQPLAPPVISKVKEVGRSQSPDGGGCQVVVMDAPPGTSCPLVETVRDADFCLLVTEPTPFGLHDLELAVEVLRVMAVPMGVVINRDGIGDSAPIERFCAAGGLPVMLKIPFSRRVAEMVARGGTLLDADPSWGPRLLLLWDECRKSADARQAGGWA
ncbi:MAG: ATP-binding protein [Bacillota bacterium]|nr:ATP-binding protein [Bacillota bacterium]